MKQLITFLIILLSAIYSHAQNWQWGLGIQSNPQIVSGVFLELEHQKIHNDHFTSLTQMSLQFRVQTELHKAAGLELSRGYRLQIGKGFYTEQYCGVGAMLSFYSQRYWYENDWHNVVYTGSNARTFDITPFLSVGVGKQFGGENGQLNSLWTRPKVFWQLPTNNPSNPYFTLQIGYSRKLGTK